MKGLQLHRHTNLLAGFFVVSALIVFGVGIFVLLYKKGIFDLTYTIQASFESGLGLRQGTDVQFNGVKIGRVESVTLSPVSSGPKRAGKVLLRLTIDKRYQDFLTEKSVAFAERDKNLVSDRVINLETRKLGGRILSDGDTVQVTDSRDIETVIGWMTKLLGKMDQLVDSIGAVVQASRDTNTSVGAMLGSRVVYDRILGAIAHTDFAVSEGSRILKRVDRAGDTLNQYLGPLLARTDSTSKSIKRTALGVEHFGQKVNGLADRGDVLLQRVDHVLLEGSGKLNQAGDLMDAVSQLWFIRSKMASPSEFPVLLNTAGP